MPAIISQCLPLSLIPSDSPIARRERPLSVGRLESAYHPATAHHTEVSVFYKGISEKSVGPRDPDSRVLRLRLRANYNFKSESVATQCLRLRSAKTLSPFLEKGMELSADSAQSYHTPPRGRNAGRVARGLFHLFIVAG